MIREKNYWGIVRILFSLTIALVIIFLTIPHSSLAELLCLIGSHLFPGRQDSIALFVYSMVGLIGVITGFISWIILLIIKKE